MNFNLTDQQEVIRKMVRDFAQKKVKPIASEIDKNHRFPMETVEKLAEMGLMGAIMPEEYEGSALDDLSYIMAIEELSRVCGTTGCIISTHNSLVCWPILTYGTKEQIDKYLPDVASGRKIGAFALTEPSAGTDAASQQTNARLEGDHYIINGSKIFITNGGVAETFIISAMTDKSKGLKGISTFIIEKSFPGFSIGKVEDKLGIRGSSTTELVFQDMKVPKENLLGEEGQGFKIAMTSLDGGRIGIAAQALGIAQGALDETIKYVQERQQFNKPISKFQAIQFEIANMATQIEAARLLVYQAASAKNDGRPYGKLAAMAKLFAAETAMYVTTKAVQLHGGYGYTTDYPVERMMRDAKITEIYEGTSEVQKMVIAGSVIK